MIKENQSPWVVAASNKPKYPKAEGTIHAEVAVVGANITGMVSAYLLHKSGHKVVVVERNETGYGETSFSTGFLTYATDIYLTELCENFGEKKAKAIWDAGNTAIDLIEKIVKEENIECEFKRVSQYLFTNEKEDLELLQKEVFKARKLGFPIEYKDCRNCLDFESEAFIEFPNQAKFNPTKFVLKLGEILSARGVKIFEHSNVREIKNSEGKTNLLLKNAEIICDNVVLATHTPFTEPVKIEAMKLIPYITYVIEAEVEHGKIDEGLYLDTNDPYHYLRIDQINEDTDRLILGGEDNKVGEKRSSNPHDNLENWLNKLIPDLKYKIIRKWSGEIFESGDEVPLIGKINKTQLIGTGFAGNGLTFGTVTAMFASDYVNGKKADWHKAFEPNRVIVNGQILKHGLSAGMNLVKSMFEKGEEEDFDSMLPDSGQIVNIDGKKVAVYKNKKGEIIKLNPKCTHLGCTVGWNDIGKTWDCPCHGGRYYGEGKVQSGPPPKALERL